MCVVKISVCFCALALLLQVVPPACGDWPFSNFMDDECDEDEEFDCGNGECVGSLERCNGRVDCSNGRDEEACMKRNGCTRQQVRCDNGQCLRKDKVCDGYADCLDKSDESAEKCKRKRVSCLGDDEFRCRNLTADLCIKKSFLCDGHKDCPDGSDEDDCTNIQGKEEAFCESDEFQCRLDGECIDDDQICDGSKDCSDGSDEKDCDEDNGEPNSSDSILKISTNDESKNDSSHFDLKTPYNGQYSSPLAMNPLQPVEETVLHGNSFVPVDRKRGHANSSDLLFVLHSQSIDAVQRMANSIGLLSEALRAMAIAEARNHGTGYHFYGTTPYPIAYAHGRKSSVVTHPSTTTTTSTGPQSKTTRAPPSKNRKSWRA